MQSTAQLRKPIELLMWPELLYKQHALIRGGRLTNLCHIHMLEQLLRQLSLFYRKYLIVEILFKF